MRYLFKTGWFNKNYIHTKKIDRDVAEIYRVCLENRQRCDYSVIHKPTKEKLQEHFDKVERLIDAVKKLLH